MVWRVVRSRASKSRRNSLTVKMIRPVGVGWLSRSVAVATARKAWASMARVVQRCQEVQRRTWCWSSPVRPLAAWKDSSMRQRCPATATRACRVTGRGAVAAQVGVLAGGVVAADQQIVPAGVGVVFGQQLDPGPGVVALAVAHRRPAECFCQADGQHARGVDRRGSGQRGWARAGWPRRPARNPGRDRAWRPAAVGRRRRPRRRPPTLRAPARRPRGRSTLWPVRAWSRNTACWPGFRHRCTARDPRPTTAADTGRGRSGRARAGRHRSETPRLGSSRYAQRCRCTGAAPRPNARPSSHPGFVDDQNRAGVAEGVDDVVTQIISNPVGVPFRPRQQMLQPIGSGITAMLGNRPAILAIQARDHAEPSTHRHDARVHTGQTAARSGRSPPRTRSTTDQGLRYEPRRPRHIQMSSQTPNNAAVTASTSADTPQHDNPELGGSGAGAVAIGLAVGLALLPGVSPGQLSLRPWPVSLPFPAPARQTVHAVLPHTAYRRSSPAAFGFPGPKRPGRDDDPIKADQAQVVG